MRERGDQNPNSNFEPGGDDSVGIGQLTEVWNNLPQDQKIFYAQLGIMVAVQIADALSTHAVAVSFSNAVETNIVSAEIIENAGFVGLLAAKVAVGALQVWGMVALSKKFADDDPHRKIGNILRVTNPAFALAAVNNAWLLLMK